MANLSKFFVAMGCFFIVAAVIVRFVILPAATMAILVKPSSLLILANTCFILAVLFKK